MLIYGSLFLSLLSSVFFWYTIARMLELELEQRMNIKFLVKLGKSGSEIRELLEQVYWNNAMKKTAIYKWVKRFSEGRENVSDEESSDGQQQIDLKKILQKFVKFG